MMKLWLWGTVWVFLATATLQGQSRESILKAATEAPDWAPAGDPAHYDGKNLQALAGPHAPALARYGFVGATAQTWTGPSGTVRLTLYEMMDTAAAYGLFSLERNFRQPGFTGFRAGSEGFRVSNRAYFWQSRYAVKLEGNPAATENLARIVSGKILGRSQKPPVSIYLPPQYLVAGSEKYLLDPGTIDRDLNLDSDLLGFDDSVEIATADYYVDGSAATLVLLLYPTQQVAKKYADRWEEIAPNETRFRKRIGAIVAIVRGAKDPAVAEKILAPVNYETQATWYEPPPDISLREMILTIFSFIGFALLFTFIAGLSFGGLRVFVKWRYPDRVFDRAQDMEIIQLKLTQGLTEKQLRE